MTICCSQVHTFYEAVGYMIGAQTDQAVQEHLIEKYMLLPNQVWDSIIQQATKVRIVSESKICSFTLSKLIVKNSIYIEKEGISNTTTKLMTPVISFRIFLDE